MNQSFSSFISTLGKQVKKACVFGFVFLASVLLYPTISFAGVSVSAAQDIITNNSNWTVPANVTAATFTVLGGGGGAGGGNGYGQGGNGQNGKTIKVTLPVTPGSNLPIVVGKGGHVGSPADAGTANCGNDGQMFFVGLGSVASSGLGGVGFTNGGKGSNGPGCMWSYTPSQGFGGGGGGSTALTLGTTTFVAAGGNGGIGAAGTNNSWANYGLGGVGTGTPTTLPPQGLGKGGVGMDGNDGGVIVDYFVVSGLPATPSDVTPPTLVLIGPATTTVAVGSMYIDQGVVAVDNVDGIITSQVVASSTVNTTVPGTYTVLYTVSDAAGNAAVPVVRVVNVVPASVLDTVPPVLTLAGAPLVTMNVGGTYVDLGATALDNVDGNITGNVTATSAVDTTTPGFYFVTYHVKDSAGNSATPVVRIVEVKAVDTTAPVIGLKGPSTVTLSVGTPYSELGATAVDNVDGDISNRVVISGTVGTSTPGTYTLIYSVADSAGNIATPAVRTVVVTSVDTIAPTITLVGSSTVTLQQGAAFTDLGATALDNLDGDITAKVKAVSTVNTAVPGNYFVTYSVTDASGNSAFIARLVSVVATSVDTTAPILNIIGSSTTSLLVGTSYVDLGAFAFDAVDGNLTSSVTATSTVNTTIPGTYTVSYRVVDAAGNVATALRTVIVLAAPDTIPPTLPMLGATSQTPGVPSANPIVSISWNQSSDSGSGVTGYSFVFDHSASTIPDATVDTASTSTTTTLSDGTWYFHLVAIDGAGNSSAVTTFGPIVISDSSNVTIINSTLQGVFYPLLVPTAASSTAFNLSGTTTLDASALSGTWAVDTSNIVISSFVDSTSTRSTINSSTIVGSTLTDSTVSNVTLSDVVLQDSSATSTTISNSTVQAGSTIVGGSISTSTLTSVDVTNSVISSSTITNSTLIDTTVVQGVVQNSTLSGLVVTGASSTIINSNLNSTTLGTTTLSNVVIVNDVITSGTVTPPSGVPIVITTPTPISQFVNVAPFPTIDIATTTGLQTTLLAHANDGNATSAISDAWSYYWDFGDSVTSATLNSTTTNTQVHTFAVAGTYPVSLTVFDKYGLSNATSTSVTVTAVGTSTGTSTTPTFFTLTASSTGPGAVTPTATSTLQGTDATFAITPTDASSTITSLLIDGVAVATTTSYTFTNVQADHTLFATFAALTASTSTGTSTTPDITSPSSPSNLSVITTSTTTLTSMLSASWDPSTDNVGVSGYSYLWDTNPVATLDTITETTGTSTTTVVPNGTWYFHVAAVDTSLNISTTTTFGPIVVNNLLAIDTLPPLGPTFATSTTHEVGTTSPNTLVSVNWDAASDNVGVAGYSYLWDNSPTTTPDAIPEGTGLSFDTTLPNGTWYFHVVAVDTSSNISTSTVTYGPITISTATSSDVTPPVGPILVTSGTHTVNATSTNHTITVDWDFASDDTALAGYSYLWDNSPTTTPDGVVESNSIPFTTTLPDGVWYFHIKSVDMAGNSSTPINFGPVIITTVVSTDTVPPTTPTTVTLTKTSNTTIRTDWSDASDNVGVAGYSYLWDNSPTTTPDSLIEGVSTTTTSLFADGVWYFHLVAVDTSLNSSVATTAGAIVVDTTAPQLTLTGSSTISLVAGTSTTYTELGATAFDAIDGDISSNVVATGTVDTLVPGTYTVTYRVSDAHGNAALPVSRTIHVLAVADTIAPTIAIIGSNPTSVFIGTSYTDLGATAFDNVDGVVTGSIVASSTVNTNALGAYQVLYSVADASGNIATSTRVVNVIPLTVYSIVASTTGTGFGTITPTGTTTATSTSDVVYTITPNLGNTLSSLIVDGIATTASTTYTFSNVQSDHTITAIFAPIGGAPTFSLFASSTPHGVVTPVGTTTVAQGANQSFTIVPDTLYSVSQLVVDGVTLATTSPVSFSNINADHTVEVYFDLTPLDTTPPTSVVVTSDHATNTPSVVTNTTWFWSGSTDASSGLAGYSFTFDSNPTTTPDAIVDTTQNFVSSILGPGVVYFHIVAVDNAGNSSAVTTYGPITISDSAILITNSTLGGVYYDTYAPSLATAPTLFLSGTTTIANSTVTGPWNLSNVTLASTTVASSTLSHVTASNASFNNADLTNCSVVNSLVKNYFATNCTISNSTVDPVGGLNDLTGSSVSNGSQIYASDVIYSVVSGSYIATSSVAYATLTNTSVIFGTVSTSTIDGGSVLSSTVSSATTTNSVINSSTVTATSLATSTLTNSVVDNSQLTFATLTSASSTHSVISNSTLSNSGVANAQISNSSLSNVSVLGASSTISNSTLSNLVLTDAVVINNTITSGTVTLPSGTTTIVTSPIYIPSLFNVPPVASFSLITNNLTITTVDTSADANFGSSVPDAWTYAWSFGDGATTSATTTAIGGNNVQHTYGASGFYTVTLTLTDAYGATSTSFVGVTVTAPAVVVTSGGGGGGGGNGPIDPLYFVYPRAANITTASSTVGGGGGVVATSTDNSLLIAQLEKKLASLKKELAELQLALSKPVSVPKHIAVRTPTKAATGTVITLSPRRNTSGISTIGADTHTELANVSEATKGSSWFQKVKEFVKKIFTPKTVTDN